MKTPGRSDFLNLPVARDPYPIRTEGPPEFEGARSPVSG